MAIDSNIIVYNPGSDPLVNFNFMLRVELAIDVPCKSVRAFTRELEFDQIQEGGLNDYVHMRRKPISRPFMLEIERYVGTDYVDPLPLGADLVLPVLLFVSRSPAQFVPFVTARTYVFHGCTVVKKVYGDLSADQAGILTETVTLSYREMLCVDVPWSSAGDNFFATSSAPGHSAQTLAKEPSELKKLGKKMCEDASKEKDKADKQFLDEDVTKLIADLKTLEQTVKPAVDEKTGWLVAAEAAAKGVLNGANSKPPAPLFDTVNQLRAQVSEKERALREAERNLQRLKDEAAKAEEKKNREEERKQQAATDKLLNYREQKKRNEEELKELKKKLSEQGMTLEQAEKKRDSAKEDYNEALEAVRKAEKERADELEELETLRRNLQSMENKVKAAEKELERAKEDIQKETNEKGTADEKAQETKKELERAEEAFQKGKLKKEKAEEQALEAEIALESAETVLESAKAALEAAQRKLEIAKEELKKAQTVPTGTETNDSDGAKDEDTAKDTEAAEATLKEAEKELQETEKQHKEVEKEAEAAKKKFEEAEKKFEEAEKEFEEAKADYEKAVDADKKANFASKKESKEHSDAEEMLSKRKAELKDAQDAKETAQKELETSEKKNTLEKALEKAKTERDSAKKKLDTTEQDVAVMTSIQKLEKRVKDCDIKINEAIAEGAVDPDKKDAVAETSTPDNEPVNTTDDKTDNTGEKKGEQESKPKTPIEEADEKCIGAKKALNDSKKKLDEAEKNVADAQKKLVELTDHVKQGRKYVNSLTNAISNLTLRNENVEKVRQKYKASDAACSTANSRLQALDENSPEQHNEIRTAYQEVKKHHDDTIVQTKIVGEDESYRQNGLSLQNTVQSWWNTVSTLKPAATT